MKVVTVALLLIIASVKAKQVSPAQTSFEASEERLVTGSIVSAIEAIGQAIKDAGYDPIEVDRVDDRIIILPFLFEVHTFIEHLGITGIGNIAVNTMDYSVLLSRLRFDVSLPEIFLSVGSSGAEVRVLGKRLEVAQLSGQLSVKQIRISGEARLNIGIISGISVRDLSIDFDLGGIDSQLNSVFLRIDISDFINTLLEERLTNLLLEYKAQINEALENIVWEAVGSLF